MKKLITLLLSVCMVVTLTPAISFADVSDDPQDTEQVVQMESQGDDGQQAVDPQEEPPQDEALPEDGDTASGGAAIQEVETDMNPDGWYNDGIGWKYYINGEPSTGWCMISGSWYYFGGDITQPYMQTGQRNIGNRWYYLGVNGTDPSAAGSNLGAMQLGLQNIGGKYYYYNTVGSNPSADTLGVMLTNTFVNINGKRYYFGANGILRTGWLTIGNDKYYLGNDGAMRTGWQTINGNRYFFNTGNGKMVKGGPVQIGSHKYYFNASNGKMVKGWQTIRGQRYFFNTSNGVMKTGWLTYNRNKYYLQKSGAAKVGLATIKGNRYYFQSNGAMKKNGAVRVNNKLYYFFKSGKGYKKKGWFKGSDGLKRYSLGKGRVQTGKKKIGGIWYMFNVYTGVAKTLGDNFDISIQSKTSRTSYLITVNRSNFQVRVYHGGQNNWTRVKTMTCGIGAPATPTPAGTFVTNSRTKVVAYNLNGTQVRYWYHTQFSSGSDKGFHSGLYYVDTGKPYDTALRTRSSQGSVRLALGNAEWIYYNVPLYTTVYIR